LPPKLGDKLRHFTQETLVTLQRWNAELYQALEKRRELDIDDDLAIRIQQKLAREYQAIARMAHWVFLERYESLAELVVPEQILDPEYDAVVEAAGWSHRFRDDLDILTAQARQGREERRLAERSAEPVGVRNEMPLMRAPGSCACDVAEVTLANARETERLIREHVTKPFKP